MNPSDQKTKPAQNFIAAALYNLLTILLFPVTLVGYLVWVGGALFSGRGSGVSGTAQGPLSTRFFEHQLGARPDEPASRLMLALPNVPPLGLRLFVWPMLLAHRLTGFVPQVYRYPFQGPVSPQVEAAARLTFFDTVVDRSLSGIDQFVILGAGFDTRIFRLSDRRRIRAFEVDTPQTQAVKRKALEKAGIDTAGVAFVAVDFEVDDWLARLVAAGFDPGKPALFLWEGVMPYLEREAVLSTLRQIASTARGSLVTFDYMTSEALESNAFYFRYARAATKAAGEPLKFGIDSTPPSRDRLAELLQSCGLALTEQHTLGQETAGKRAWGGFAIAMVKEAD